MYSVATRADVTKDEFRAIFTTDEECYRAAYERGLSRLSRSVAAAADRQDGWLERVRCGLVALLGFFDDHPSWARLLVLETSVGASTSFECRKQLHEVLGPLLDHHRPAGIQADSQPPAPALTGDLIVGGVFSLIRSNMHAQDGGKLVELAPSLMAFIVAPYLGQAAARAELEGSPYGRNNAPVAQGGMARARAISRTAELPIRATHRTTLVLRAIAQTPYLNNREVAQAAGLVDEGQTSKLLARLERQGVIENVGVGAARGEPNAWLLTAEGRRVVELLGENAGVRSSRSAGGEVRGAA